MTDLPPVGAATFAAAYQCTDCDSETRLVPGRCAEEPWTVKVLHSEGCPVLNGHVSGLEAEQAAAEQVPDSKLLVVAVEHPESET